MIAQELIRSKRDGHALAGDEIAWLIANLDRLSPAQIGALLMAMWLRGLDEAETVALTAAMRDSGAVLQWDFPTVDKHSTGGVGDKVSLILAPLAAAAGAHVPMISGRALGHTGGTLDKLDAIPGYRSQPTLAEFRRVVAGVGCAIVGQTDELAPADRTLYAIRDATATVESIPLIVASILAKKLAAGLERLVMDVKTGSGAFLPETEDARALAAMLERVAAGNGLACEAHLTPMDQVLGRSAGNALEVREAIAMLRGEPADARLRAVTLQLTQAMVPGADLDRALATGAAAERFARMVAALGGPADLLERPDDHLPAAPVQLPVPRTQGAGPIRRIDVRALGMCVLELGGGRIREDQPVDHAVGLTEVAALGESPDVLAVVHARDTGSAERAAQRLRLAYE